MFGGTEDSVKIPDSNKFSMMIEYGALETNMNIIDFLVSYCEEMDVLESEVVSLLTPSLIEKIEFEAKQRKMMKNNCIDSLDDILDA